MGCIFTPYWDVPVLLRPSASGGSNFNPSSYHQPTGYIFVFGLEQNGALATNLYTPRTYEPGKSYSRTSSAPVIGATISNTVSAMDSRTNKIVWQKRTPGANNYGAFSTASGLMFTGQVDGNLTRIGQEVGNPTTTLGGTWIFQGTVRTLDFRFDPTRVQVPVGTTVSWENQGGTIHTVTAQKGQFDSGDIPAGGTFSATF